MKLHEIALTPPVAAISVMLLALTAFATPKVVYVVPGGAGEKDGTSWGNAYASVSNAYASAAAYADDGFDSGEVWIKRGMYAWEHKNQKIAMQSNVSVRGGFDGTETAAEQADPKKNVTVLTGNLNKSAFWCPNDVDPATADRITVWGGDDDNLKYNEPNPDGADDHWSAQRNYNDVYNGFYAPTSVDNCEFSGVWFSCFLYDSVGISVRSTNIRFKKCGFIGSNTGRNGSGADAGIVLNNTHATIEDCEFVGNHNCVILKRDGGGAAGITIFRNCMFRKTNNSVVSCDAKAGSSATDNVYAFENCVFEDNRTQVYYGSQTAPCTLLFTDCVFRKNKVSGGCGVIATAGSTSGGSAQIHIVRCAFTDNESSPSGSGKKCTCLFFDGMSKREVVRDCYFARNKMTYGGTSDGGAVICFITNANQYPAFVNCTFEDNVAESTAIGTYAATFAFVATNTRYGFANCVFANNQMTTADGTRAAEVYSPAPAAGAALVFANSIFTNAAAAYLPYRQDGGTKLYPLALGMAVPDRDKIDLSGYSNTSTITDQDPGLSKSVKKGVNGTFAHGVSVDSPYKKNGHSLVASDNGYDYYVDGITGTTPWRALCGGNACTAADLGITDETPLVADAFGEARVRGKIAYGPLNAPTAGLMLLLR